MSAALDQSLRFAGRNLRRMRRNPSTLAGTFVTPLVFLFGFFVVLQRTLASQGIDYAQFLPPAVVVQATLNAAMGSAFWLADDATTGVLARARSMPISRLAPLAGRILADLTRVAVSTVVILAVGALLGFRFSGGVLAAVAFLGLVLLWSAAAAAGFGLIALRSRNPESTANLLTLPFLPLLLLSTAFVPAERFPAGLEPLAGHQPVSAVIDALRALATDGLAPGPLVPALAWALGLLVLFLALSVRLQRARR